MKAQQAGEADPVAWKISRWSAPAIRSMIRMKTGVSRDGTLVAREVELLARRRRLWRRQPRRARLRAADELRSVRFRTCIAHGRVAYTNKLRFGAFRGFGVPQVAFAGETQIDEIADALKLDPIDFRCKNIKRGRRPGSAAS